MPGANEVTLMIDTNLPKQNTSTHVEPEELQSIHELFAGDEEIPLEGDEDTADKELSHEEVKSHTDNAVEDETNSSLYQGQHLPE